MSDNAGTESHDSLRPKRRKLIAFPGEEQGIVAVPHYIGDKAHLNAHGPKGAPGLYTVGFVLAKPNTRNSPENEIKFADALRGDSHLAIASPAVIIDINPDQVEMSYRTASGAFIFHGFPNEEGYLAKLISEPFFAADRDAAQRTAATAMQGLLSNLSSQLDIPLSIEVVEVIELATQARGISFIAPFAAVPMSVQGAGAIKDPEFEHALALYREALNSNTQVYRFLCFYKILELSRKRRGRVGRKHKSALKQVRPGRKYRCEIETAWRSG